MYAITLRVYKRERNTELCQSNIGPKVSQWDSQPRWQLCLPVDPQQPFLSHLSNTYDCLIEVVVQQSMSTAAFAVSEASRESLIACPTITLSDGTLHPAIGFGTYKVGFIPASASAAAGWCNHNWISNARTDCSRMYIGCLGLWISISRMCRILW